MLTERNNQVLCHFFQHKSHTQWPKTNRLNHGTAPFFRWLSRYWHIY